MDVLKHMKVKPADVSRIKAEPEYAEVVATTKKYGFRPCEYDNYEELNDELLRVYVEVRAECQAAVRRQEARARKLIGDKRIDAEEKLASLRRQVIGADEWGVFGLRHCRDVLERALFRKRKHRQQACMDPATGFVRFIDKPRKGKKPPDGLILLDGADFSPAALGDPESGWWQGNFHDPARRIAYLCGLGFKHGNVERLDPLTRENMYYAKKLYRQYFLLVEGRPLRISTALGPPPVCAFDLGVEVAVSDNKTDLRRGYEFMAACVNEGARIERERKLEQKSQAKCKGATKP